MGNRIVWGNGHTFADNHFTDYVTYESDKELALDFDFYDLNDDGKEEFILSVTDDYKTRRIQIMSRNERSFRDVTEEYFPENDYLEEGVRPALWIKVEETEGKVYLVGRMMDNGERLFQLIDRKFIKVDDELKLEDGIVLYDDGIEQVTSHWDPGYNDSPYGGKTCIKCNDWTDWESFSLWSNYDEWIDFSSVVSDNYCLEFAIKNSDPDLVISFNYETLLQTDPWYFPTYFYFYRAEEHNANGEWEVIRVPLKDCVLDDEWKGGYYWNTIKSIYVSACEYHGKEFYLDEIRIRRILDTQQP